MVVCPCMEGAWMRLCDRESSWVVSAWFARSNSECCGPQHVFTCNSLVVDMLRIRGCRFWPFQTWKSFLIIFTLSQNMSDCSNTGLSWTTSHQSRVIAQTEALKPTAQFVHQATRSQWTPGTSTKILTCLDTKVAPQAFKRTSQKHPRFKKIAIHKTSCEDAQVILMLPKAANEWALQWNFASCFYACWPSIAFFWSSQTRNILKQACSSHLSPKVNEERVFPLGIFVMKTWVQTITFFGRSICHRSTFGQTT